MIASSCTRDVKLSLVPRRSQVNSVKTVKGFWNTKFYEAFVAKRPSYSPPPVLLFRRFSLSNFSWRRADREERERERERCSAEALLAIGQGASTPRARDPRGTGRGLAVAWAAASSPVSLRPGSDFAGSGQEIPRLVRGRIGSGGGDMGVGAEPKEDAAAAGSAAAAEEGAGGKEEKAAAVSCSICLDAVLAAAGERSTARLQCGHEFHLGECP